MEGGILWGKRKGKENIGKNFMGGKERKGKHGEGFYQE